MGSKEPYRGISAVQPVCWYFKHKPGSEASKLLNELKCPVKENKNGLKKILEHKSNTLLLSNLKNTRVLRI